MSVEADLLTLAVLRALHRVEVTARVCGELDDMAYHLQLTRNALLDELGPDPQSAYHLQRALETMARQYRSHRVLAQMLEQAAEQMHRLKLAL